MNLGGRNVDFLGGRKFSVRAAKNMGNLKNRGEIRGYNRKCTTGEGNKLKIVVNDFL